MRKCHLILKQIVKWMKFEFIHPCKWCHMAWGIPVGTCLLRSSLTAPLPLFSPPNYKQGMFASWSSQVATALGTCLAVKSELLSAFVIDVSGSEVTPRSNMNMERFELSDGRRALTTSADKINWKQLPMGVWTERVICFLFLFLVGGGGVLHLHPLTLMQSQVISRDGGNSRVYAISGSTMCPVIPWMDALWLRYDCTEKQQFSFGKEKDF